MTVTLTIPAHNALEITEVLRELSEALESDLTALRDPRTFKAHCALTTLQRAFTPVIPIIRAEVKRLDADTERLF